MLGVAKTAIALMTGQKQLEEFILVGVSSDNRFRDMSPSPMARFEGSGHALKFIAFLEKELLPFLDQYYRIDPTDRCFIGHSLGGLLGTYIILEKPTLFNCYILGSPSYWWNDKEIVTRLTQKDSLFEGSQVKLYTYIGGNEAMMVDDWKAFNTILRSKLGKNVQYRERIFLDESHASVVTTAFAPAIKFMYGIN